METASRLLSRCLTATLLLSGCAGLRQFPTDRLWEYSPADHVCAEYQITEPQDFRFRHLRDVPEGQCPAIFGFLASDIPNVLNWARDSVKYGKTHCK